MNLEFLRHLPVQRKLLVLTLSACGVILLLACAGLFAFQVFIFKKTFARDLTVLAKVLAANASGPLTFGDRKAAADILKALTAEGHVVAAQIQLADGNQFATAGTMSARYPGSPGELTEGARYEGWNLFIAQNISHDQEMLGTLYVRADFRQKYFDLVWLYGGILALVFGGSFVVALLVSARLQRFITDPVLNLAETARAVAGQRDYSVRAKKMSYDEFGLLTDAFNQMLEQIQRRDSALQLSQQKFETLVNSIEGVVWEADPHTLQFVFVSRQAERLLGYPLATWLNDPAFFANHVHPEDRSRVIHEFQQATGEARLCSVEFRMLGVDESIFWIRSYCTIVLEDKSPILLRGVLLDITGEKKAAQELAELHAELVSASRQAGMAEVATGVLHNVGNVLNSVNVSSTLVCDRVRKSEVGTLGRVAALLREHAADLPAFLTTHPKGKMIPDFIQSLAAQLATERADTLREMELLAKNIEHIKEIVAMQQSYARISGVVETLPVPEMVEDALQINAAGFQRHGVQVVRQFDPVPPVSVDRHKVLQILINLLRNAKYAMDEANRDHKQLTLGISLNGHGCVKISVQDNGIGIPRENLTRIFSHGFTTRKEGHGFGLHSGALAAKEMGGALHAYSEGPGRGATFVLELPISQEHMTS